MSSSTTNQPRVSMACHPWPPFTAKALEGNAVNVSLGNTEDTKPSWQNGAKNHQEKLRLSWEHHPVALVNG